MPIKMNEPIQINVTFKGDRVEIRNNSHLDYEITMPDKSKKMLEVGGSMVTNRDNFDAMKFKSTRDIKDEKAHT